MFGLLGSLVVADTNGRPVPVAGSRLRVLLAALLLHANTPVAGEVLADLVWDAAPPPSAEQTLRSHIVRLRRALGSQAGAEIVTRVPGYLIVLEPRQLDVLEFEAACRAAGEARRAGTWDRAADAAAHALRLWRGTPLADVPCQALRDAWLPRLEQARVLALEWHIEAGLRLGHREQLIAELHDLTARHPLRERFHAQLMLALAGSGRRAEALAAYQNARRILIDELGVEPGPELRGLHQRILAGDAELPAATAAVGAAPAADLTPTRSSIVAMVPHQLPMGIGHFVGRVAELKALGELLGWRVGAGEAVVISAIGGTAGIGKTTLAVHWARLHADRFPDGQLYVNLRGFDPAGEPMAPAEAVRRFLDALGVPPERVPAGLDEQAALYRTRLADRRVLVVLDNARDVEQVRPLLPGAPGCLVLVTSRNLLGALVALDGAVSVTLDLLTEQEARDLLIHRLGHERVAAEEQAVGALIRACARLPLALNIAAAHAALHPARSLSELVDRLGGTCRRLDALAIGVGAGDVRAVFSWSYRSLGTEAARVFRLLGVHPGFDIGLAAAASLTALDLDGARRAFDELTAAHLVTEHGPDRYGFHDLLRAYAADQAHIHDSRVERQQALRRVCDFYLHTARAADRLLDPHRRLIEFDPPAPGTRPDEPADDPAAMAWFDVEHANLLAVQKAAAAHGWHPVVWQLAWTLVPFHRRRGHDRHALAAWRRALEAAAHLPDPTAYTSAHRFLGRIHADLGHHAEAIEHLHQALALAERHHDPGDQARIHYQLAWAWERHGDDRQALAHATSALRIVRTGDQTVQVAHALNAVGWYSARLGDYEAARSHCQAALALHQRHGNPEGEAATLDSLGYIEHHAGHHHQAIDHYRQALTLRHALDDTSRTAGTLESLGSTHASLAQHEQAHRAWQQALEAYQQQGRTEDADRVQHHLDTLRRARG